MFDIPKREISAAQIKRERQEKERWQRCVEQAHQEINPRNFYGLRDQARRRATDLYEQGKA